MRRIIIAICGIFIAGVASAVPAMVDYIIDGDTFAARVNLDDDIKITVRVRIANVDTPELHGNCDYEICMANIARDRLAQLIPIGSIVELTGIHDDKYLGRIDANVFDVAGNDVGKILIKEKLGRAYNGGRRTGWCK